MSQKIKVAIASDKAGFPFKQAVTEYLNGRDDVEVIDFCLNSADEVQPYHAQAPKVARAHHQQRQCAHDGRLDHRTDAGGGDGQIYVGARIPRNDGRSLRMAAFGIQPRVPA